MAQLHRPSAALGLWVESGAMRVLVPQLGAVERHTLAAVDCVPPPPLAGAPARAHRRRLARLAVLFSDLDAPAVARGLAGLRFSKSDAAAVTATVDRVHRTAPDIETALRGGGAVEDAQVRRWVADIGRLNVPIVMRVASARWAARRAAG